MKGLKLVRTLAWIAVAGAAGGTLLFSGSIPRLNSDPSPRVATVRDISQIGGPFRLTSQRGQSVDNASLAGKPYLAFFGFTYCPDICPTTLSDLTDLMRGLGSSADRLNALFITIDPERDTQDLLARYMTSFDPRIQALRGNRDETDRALKAFAAEARRVPIDGGNYTMDHTAGVYMMDASGKLSGMLDMHEPRETKLRKLHRLIDNEA